MLILTTKRRRAPSLEPKYTLRRDLSSEPIHDDHLTKDYKHVTNK